MFSWATSHLEKITNTLAPPPSDAAGRFVYCCQRDDEQGAMECVSELMSHGAGVVVNTAKGQTPLHVACQFSLLHLVRVLLQQPGATIDQLYDSNGNTPLHAACTSTKANALEVIQLLVKEHGADVTIKNHNQETPYDVATLNSIRQYLLPIQLQKETQHALDNGGVGLPPGIDLGGLRINNAAGTSGPPPLAPPPIVGGSTMASSPIPPPPTSWSTMAAASPGAPQTFATPATKAEGNTSYAPNSTPAFLTTPPTQSGPPSVPGPMSFSQRSSSTPLESSTNELKRSIPPAPTSSGVGASSQQEHQYALSGHSSAAIYKPTGRRFIQPDGFHSSSSDKRLQEKYGHEIAGLHVPKVVPPPPSSGNNNTTYTPSPVSGTYYATSAQQATQDATNTYNPVASAPPSLGTYHNPYAGGVRSLTNRRYVAIDPITGQQQAPMSAGITPPTSTGVPLLYTPSYLVPNSSSSSTPSASMTPSFVAPNVTMFMPGGASQPTSTSNITNIALPRSAATSQMPPFPMSQSAAPAQRSSPLSSTATSANDTTPTAATLFGSISSATSHDTLSPNAAAAAAAATSIFSTPSAEDKVFVKTISNEPSSSPTSAATSSPTAAHFDPTRSNTSASAASLFSSPSSAGNDDMAARSTNASATATSNNSEPPSVPKPLSSSCQLEPLGMFPKPPVLSSKFALPPNYVPKQQENHQQALPATTSTDSSRVASATLFGSDSTSATAAVETPDPPATTTAAVGASDTLLDDDQLDDVPLSPEVVGGKSIRNPDSNNEDDKNDGFVAPPLPS